MSVSESVQTTAKASSNTSSGFVLQRKCACGGSAGFSGECEGCRNNKLLGRPLQRKLAISEPGDRYEQEADRIAEQVMASSGSGAVTPTPIKVQRFTGSPSGQPMEVPTSVERVLASPGQPLELAVQDEMGRRFGHDFSQVRVHSDKTAELSARDLNAHAYTVGNHVVFGIGRFAPETHEGRRLLAHELSHAIQQGTVLLKRPSPMIEDAAITQADLGSRISQSAQKDGKELVNACPNEMGQSTRPTFVLQMMRYESSTSANSVTILQQLAAGENTAAMRAVVQAIRETLRGSDMDVHIVGSGGGDQFDLTMASEDADIMRQQLEDRIQSLTSTSLDSSLDGGDPAVTDISRDALTEGFNREFEAVLPALRHAGRTMSGGEEESRSLEFTTAELYQMFSSATQRRKILDYCNTHMVPDRLFNGDDVGNANAQQRIILSAHILTNGTIRAGSFTQRLHARFCGHWVELVNSYAGVGTTGGRGIENEFDSEGELVMGSGHLACEYEGSRIAIDETERGEGHTHRRFRRAPLQITDFDWIQPGDWLYVFTNTDTAGGDHSVIFSNWLGEVQESDGIHYREAAVFSQTNVERGGARDEWLLGDQAGRVHGRPVYPITRVARHNPDDHPPRTVAEVEATDLGVRVSRSSVIARQNDRFIRLHTPRGRHINRNALNHFLQESNSTLLGQLESMGRAEPGQLMLWEETNRSTALEVLVRLNERFNNLIRGANTLTRAEEAEALRVDPRREAALLEAERRRNELEPELDQLEADIERFEAAMAIGSGVRTLRRERDSARRRRRRIERRLAYARGDRRTSLIKQRRAIIAAYEELGVQIETIEAQRDAAIGSALAMEGNWRLGRSSPHEHINRLRARRDRLLHQIQDLEEAGGFRLAHPGREFRSIETMGRITGLLQHADPQPTWSELLD